MSIGPTAIDTGIATVIAERKLPDDLALVEYSEILSALESLCHMAARVNSAAPSSTILIRARYGSDFQVIVTVAAAIAGTILALCKGVGYLATAAKDNATAHREQAAAELDAASARKMNAEAALLEAQAHVGDLPQQKRIDALRERVTDEQLRRAVVEHLRATEALGSSGRLADAARGASRNPHDVSDVEDLARSVIVLGSYDIRIIVES
ncbi:hypothetical protein [Agromyces larvae]|uniref:Uncharacterized protein n=1 Tax=Agromyces larvae TaxID=2929802 RepID=A0ABY4C134_9MICO|nr:hypothetical protein [Agromyces larvae]UOE45135.1 hypothetical protein MTO99_04970 [Agromyces larvae]